MAHIDFELSSDLLRTSNHCRHEICSAVLISSLPTTRPKHVVGCHPIYMGRPFQLDVLFLEFTSHITACRHNLWMCWCNPFHSMTRTPIKKQWCVEYLKCIECLHFHTNYFLMYSISSNFCPPISGQWFLACGIRFLRFTWCPPTALVNGVGPGWAAQGSSWECG